MLESLDLQTVLHSEQIPDAMSDKHGNRSKLAKVIC